MDKALSQDADSLNVGVNIRVIANGFDLASQRLRATLVVTPRVLRKGEALASSVRLDRWPADIAAYMEALTKSEGEFPLKVLSSPNADPAASLAPAFVHLDGEDPGLARVCEMWESAFGEVSDSPWTHLLADIDRSENGKKQRTDALCDRYPGDTKQATDPIDETGALQVESRRPDDPLRIAAVVVNPQTRHAVEVEAARAQRVCAQMANTLQPVARSENKLDPITTPMAAGPEKPAVDAGRKEAFKKRFHAMIEQTNDSRKRAHTIFGNVANSLSANDAAVVPLPREEALKPYAPRPQVHGVKPGPVDEANKFALRAGHVYGSWPQQQKRDAAALSPALGAPSSDEAASLHSIYFTLQGDPLLSRLFGLAFDITFKVPEGDPKERLLYLAGQKDGILTAALLGARVHDSDPISFWPAPRAFARVDSGAPQNEQRHGVYRFDGTQQVTSVDVRSAVSDAPDGVDRGAPHQTVGFSFLDGLAADRAARDLAIARNQQTLFATPGASLVLYAEELAIGRRLDVGVAGQWRSLMYRYVGHPGLDSAVRQRLDNVAKQFEPAAPREGHRYLEETSFQRLTRAIPAVGDPDHSSEAVVEEAYMTWGGAPLGALACKSGENASGGCPIMPVSRTYDLPGAEFGKRRPPPLRYGVAYQFGMRACYLGGGGPSLKDATPIYEASPDAVLPNDGQSATPKRFLRHEAIAAPVLLLPASLIEGSPGPMGFEPPMAATLRTAKQGDPLSPGGIDNDPPGPAYIEARSRGTGSTTYRVFVAPMAGMDFCARHGAFDDPTTSKKALSGGLLDVCFLDEEVKDRSNSCASHRHTGFPLAKVSRKEGFNADQVVYQREIGKLDSGSDEALGAAVFQSRGSVDHGRAPGRGYLPDPAAMQMSLRVRVADSDLYLAEDICVPLYAHGAASFPNAMPVLVEVIKQDRLRPSLARKAKDVVEHLGTKRFRFDEHGVAPSRSGVLVQHVRVTLCQCEQFDIEATCLPDKKELARWFSVVETIGVQTLWAQVDEKCAERRKDVCGAHTASFADRAFGALKKGGHSGLANSAACTPEGHEIIADRLLSFVRQTRPLAEIAAVGTLRVTHAVNAPSDAPCLRNVAVARADDKTPKLVSVSSDARGSDDLKPVRFQSRAGATRMLLTGEIEVDLEQIDALEINAYAVSPDGKPFDDANRGRGLLSRRNGRWPSVPSSDGTRKPYLKRAVFGFDVSPEGRSHLVQEKLTLLRIGNLPDPRVALESMKVKPLGGEPTVFLGMRGRLVRLDLGALHLAALHGTTIEIPRRHDDPSAGTRTISVVRPHDIVDVRARLLNLEAVGVSRFARAFETTPLYDGHGKEHILARRRPLRARDQRKTAQSIQVCSPSTARPAAVSPRTPVPYFRVERCASGGDPATHQTLSRKCGIRLRFDRGWFSAGERERVGIVLWPPLYRDQNPEDLEQNKVTWRDRQLDLSAFMDADLGDAGPFVSRWGGDPIRADLTPQRGWFIPPTAFACLDKGEVDEYVSNERGAPERAHSPRYVNSVTMPVEVAAGDTENPDELRKSSLDVSLITFEPYFDIEAEEWYVDVPLSLCRATDPFIRLGLVRYQPNAASDELIVSTPVRVWTQLPPHRQVTVTNQRGEGTMHVTAVANGQASAGIKPLPVDIPDLMALLSKPRMRLTVLHESDDANGVRRQVRLDYDPKSAGVSPEVKNGEFQWVMSAKIEDDELQDLPSGRLVAWIEEIEHRLPATYPNEPCSLNQAYDAAAIITSGPRFLAKVPFSEHAAST